MDPDENYQLLGQLLNELPVELFGADELGPEQHRWLGRCLVMAKPYLSSYEVISLSSAATNLTGILKESNGQRISVLLHLALANAEMAASAPLKGMFLGAATPFDAFVQIGKVIGSATNDVLFVEPYADEKLLDEFARLADENISVRVLTDSAYLKSTLEVAARRWRSQFATSRSLEIRIGPSKSLHDRFVIIDRSATWQLGQSFNGLAARAPTTIVRLPSEPSGLAIAAMETAWASATLMA